MVDIILSGYTWRSCLVYLEDASIFSSSLDDHLRHVEEVLEVLKAVGMTLCLEKYHLFAQSVEYLGLVIRPSRLEFASKNTNEVAKAKPPHTQTKARSFLRLSNVYGRYLKNFATVAAPLTELTSKEYSPRPFPLTAQQLIAFDEIKLGLTQPPILHFRKANVPYTFDTDTSAGQIERALMQEHEKKKHPLGYWSRSLNSAERKYCAT